MPHDHAAHCISSGVKYPYVAGLNMNEWSIVAALGALADLTGRKGVKQELQQVDENMRCEIVFSLAAIIRLAARNEQTAVDHAQFDYRKLDITRRASRIRDTVAGRDRVDTNQPERPFVLLGRPVDITDPDEVLVAAVAWAEEQGGFISSKT